MLQSPALNGFAELHRLLFVCSKSVEGDTQEFVYSQDKLKRYAYLQSWEPSRPCVLWVMLNPGTGETEGRRRNTLERCKAWSKQWGFGGLLLGNVFATRTKSAKQLLERGDVADEYNEQALVFLREQAAETIVAWGSKGSHQQRSQTIAPLLGGAMCLGTTAKGEPRHPLYVPKSTQRIHWLSHEQAPNPSIEGTCSSGLRPLTQAPHVKR